MYELYETYYKIHCLKYSFCPPFFAFLNWCYYQHMSKDSMFAFCPIFSHNVSILCIIITYHWEVCLSCPFWYNQNCVALFNNRNSNRIKKILMHKIKRIIKFKVYMILNINRIKMLSPSGFNCSQYFITFQFAISN